MTIVESLNGKINGLKENSQEAIDKNASILQVINDAIKALNDDELLIDYDFSIAINLVNPRSFGIIDLEKSIRSIKNTLIAKYRYKQTFLTLPKDLIQARNSFRERLGYLKEEYEGRVSKQKSVKIDDSILENSIDLKNLLEGRGRRKYYTYEMLEAFFELFDYNGFSYQDMEQFVKELGVSKNLGGKIHAESTDFEEVKELFKKYLDKRIKLDLLEKYQSEICYRINISNASKILEFFEHENLIDKFSIISLLQIVLYGRFEYIVDFYNERVLPKSENVKKIYFDDAMSCVWINENEVSRSKHNHFIRREGQSSKQTLYSSIHEVCDDDVWENVRLIKENESIFSSKYDLSDIGYLWVITKPVWLIKKNIELFKLFGFQDVQFTALAMTDLEDKIHLVTELGLLNTPQTHSFREMEKGVPKYNEFNLNGKKKKLENRSILNYYPRNTSEIGRTTYREYIYWFYKMQRCGKEEFYKNFFSGFMAGRRNKTDFYDESDKEKLRDYRVIEQIIDENFVTNYYDQLIPHYDEYNEDIREYSSSSQGDVVIPYFDEGILRDEIVQRLDSFVPNDAYLVDVDVKRLPNEFTYVFDKCIISRYKVLRNLSILKSKHGYLDNNMLLTAIVRNSYIDRDTFDFIKDAITKGSFVK